MPVWKASVQRRRGVAILMTNVYFCTVSSHREAGMRGRREVR